VVGCPVTVKAYLVNFSQELTKINKQGTLI